MTFTLLLSFFLLHAVVSLFMIVRLLRYRFEPSYMLVWVLMMAFIPFLGALLYARLGENQVMLRAQRKRGHCVRPDVHLLPTEEVDTVDLGQFKSAADVGVKLLNAQVTRGNDIRVHEGSEAIHSAWMEAMRAAKESIHMEFYIWGGGETGAEVRDLLVQRAAEGIQCRVLMDAVGSIRLTQQFLKPFADSSVKFAFFLPLSTWKRRWSPHLRNHRKILVIDRDIAFIGSQNVSDEDRGRHPVFSPWHNVQLRVQGPAARQLEAAFLSDWNFASEEEIPLPRTPATGTSPEGGIVQILPTGPDCVPHILERTLLEAINNARTSISIITPYFVPPPMIRLAMLQATMRGVRVRIIVSALTDQLIALYAGRSFYEELLSEGVEIYEYTEGLLHSKIVLVDNAWAMAGSVNMDYRSLRLNFEVSALLYDEKPVLDLARIVDAYRDASRRVTMAELARRPLRKVLLEGAARVLSSQL